MRRDAKHRMIRIAVCGDQLRIDEDTQMPGRGGYLHRRGECLTKFTRSKVKEFRSLKRKIGLDERLRIAELIRTRLDSTSTLE